TLRPELPAAAAHALHGVGDVDVVLEELDGHRLVYGIFLGQLKGDAHHVQAEHGDPAGAVRLFENRAVEKRLAAVDDGDVVQPQKAAFEDAVAFAIDLVDPP